MSVRLQAPGPSLWTLCLMHTKLSQTTCPYLKATKSSFASTSGFRW